MHARILCAYVGTLQFTLACVDSYVAVAQKKVERTNREQSSILIKTFLMPSGLSWIQAGLGAQTDSQEGVEQNPGKDQGSAHLPVGLATILALLQTEKKWGERAPETRHLEELKTWW